MVFSGFYHFDCTVENGNWNFEPKLPSTLNFVKAKQILSGTPMESSETQQYTLTVSNEAGKSTFVFTITVEDCKYGFYLIRRIMGSSHVFFKHDPQVLEDRDITVADNVVNYCLPKGFLSLTLTCYNSSAVDCVGEVMSSDNKVYIFMHLQKGESKTITTKMEPTEAPSISVRDNDMVVAVEQEFETVFDVQGIHGAFTFAPELPSNIIFDESLYILRGRPLERGVFSYMVTVANELGIASLQWTLYADVCPDGQSILRIKGTGSIEGGYTLLDSAEKVIIDENLPLYRFKKSYCVTDGSYSMVMRGTDDTPMWSSPLLLLDSYDNVVESFQKNNRMKEQKERFVVGNEITEQTHFKFVNSDKIDEKWTSIDFDDSKWKEDVAGNWGEYASSKKNAYFRTQITIPNPQQFAQVVMQMTLADHAVFYLNGQQLRSFSRKVGMSNEVTTHTTFPSTFLVKGKNQIAVVLEGEEGKSILFQMQLHLTTSQCIQPSITGKALSNEEKPNHKRPASAAFNYGFTWWEPYQVPVTLTYWLNNDDYIMPSLMTISSKHVTPEARPIAFEVFGQVIDHTSDSVVTEDSIASVSVKAFLNNVESETVSLSPKQPYNAFRIVFTQSTNSTSLRVHGLSFSTCQEDRCPKAGKIPSTRVGSIITRDCPSDSYGVNQYVCGRKDVEPHWEEDRSMCLSTQPVKGIAYVDTSFTAVGLRKVHVEEVQKAIEKWAPSYLIKKEDISLPLVVETVEDVNMLNMTMRLTVESDMGKVVKKVMTEQLTAFKMYMYQELVKYHCTSFKITSSPMLFEPPTPSSSNGVVVMICSCCAIVAFVAGYCLHKCCKKSSQKKEGLLETSV